MTKPPFSAFGARAADFDRWVDWAKEVRPITSSGPSQRTVKKLFALSSNRCAFPECQTPIIDDATGTVLAEVCHIRSRRKGGPRYESSQTDEERNGFDNLVLLCRNHHKIIDTPDNLEIFTVEHLMHMKAALENHATEGGLPPLSPAALTALRLTGTTYETGSTHMDFRHAKFQIGGEGGSSGGGGGGGGVLTIVGMARLPPDFSLDLNGQPGQAPGGGGGGAGALRFVGRPVELQDLDAGFHASTFLTANAVRLDSLLNILAGGWSYCPIQSIPQELTLTFAFIVECGNVQPGTLLTCTVEICSPSGETLSAESVDVEVPNSIELAPRVPRFVKVRFTATDFGKWIAHLKSGDTLLSTLPFEVRREQEVS